MHHFFNNKHSHKKFRLNRAILALRYYIVANFKTPLLNFFFLGGGGGGGLGLLFIN